jgi:lipid-binding SYLF domain-containing protein
MNRRAIVAALSVASLLAWCPAALGQGRENATVETARGVLADMVRLPEQGIPPALLSRAQAIAIIPGVIKAGFLVGGRFGRGIVMVRDAAGNWSNPVFVTLGGGSFGFQAGAQSTDLILVFRNRRSVDSFLLGRGKFTLGADASVAAGPLGRTLGAGTDVTLASEILSYSRSRGLFAGVSLDGSAVALDWASNVDFYGEVAGPAAILGGAPVTVPESAQRLKAALRTATGAPAVEAAPSTPASVTPAPGAFRAPRGSRTYQVADQADALQPTGSVATIPVTGRWKRPGERTAVSSVVSADRSLTLPEGEMLVDDGRPLSPGSPVRIVSEPTTRGVASGTVVRQPTTRGGTPASAITGNVPCQPAPELQPVAVIRSAPAASARPASAPVVLRSTPTGRTLR